MTKILKQFLITASAFGMLAAGAASATDSIVIPVTATVIGTCKFATPVIPTLTIANSGANIDPSIAGNATGTATISYKCTKGQSPTSFVLTGLGSLTLSCTTPATCVGESMVATMSVPAGPYAAGLGFAALAQTIVLTGTIADTIYQAVSVGTYQANQTVTVNP